MPKAPSGSNATPMMRQYQAIKNQIPRDAILMFRLGDFFEMFFEDAKKASGVLDIALTQRQGTPMCGVPYHAADGYIAQLVRAGYKVALCDQVEDPKQAKGIVKRELMRVVTPGTILQADVLQADTNNYLAAVHPLGKNWGLAFLDVSTGEFRLTQFFDPDALRAELNRIGASEWILAHGKQDPVHKLLPDTVKSGSVNPCDDWWFDLEIAYQALTDHFQTQSLDGFGCRDLDAAVAAAGALLQYVQEHMRSSLEHVSRLQVYQSETYVDLDPATIRNLELLEPLHDGPRQNSLLGVLNQTTTPMGSRLMRSWIRRPLREIAAIQKRQSAVADLVPQPGLIEELQESLKQVKDLERTLARLTVGSGNGRDLLTLRLSLEAVPRLQNLLGPLEAPLIQECTGLLDPLQDLVHTLNHALVDEPPLSIRDGGIIRPGYAPQLDELRSASSDGKKWIAELQAKEQRRTGIKSLKIRYNKVFGYYIEITNANLDHVPDDYIRRQTLANAERFITPELQEYQEKILGAEDHAKELEYQIFMELRGTVLAETAGIQQNAGAVATIDCIAAFAKLALYNDYCRPALFEDNRLSIKDGRHPVLELNMVGERFVPNDLEMNTEDFRLLVITGPNMAGKSTFIRQAALITIMAQIGSYVPAAAVELGIADRIFTRVGASDDLSRGQSTFMVEMSETANILNNATQNSLVILDEIGRGTSTFDGLSIAWAVAEHLHDQIGARTLFATHYHELTELAMTHHGVQNLNVAVREWNDQIMFLHKILPGAADKSYGIHVARLAGLPEGVLERAREVLANLENNEYSQSGKPKLAHTKKRKLEINDGPQQLHLTLFEDADSD